MEKRLLGRCFKEVIEQYNLYFQRKVGSVPGIYKKSNEDHYCFIPSIQVTKIIGALDEVKEHIRRKSLPYCVQPLKFLDCGCGIGNIMLIARAVGYEVYGIEYEKATCKIARDLTWEDTTPRRQKKNDAIIHGDITEFEHYADYDVIYYYTPIKNSDKREYFLKKLSNDAKIGGIILSYGSSNYFECSKRFKTLSKAFDAYEKVS